MEPGAQTCAQTHLRQSFHDSQGYLLRNPESQRVCSCRRCPNLQQATDSSRASEVLIQNSCLQHQGLTVCTGVDADFHGECRYGLHSSRWPAHLSPHVPGPQGPCHGIDAPHVPRSPMAMGAASAPGYKLAASRLVPPGSIQEKDGKENGRRMEANSEISGSYGEPLNQVILYRWFLIRCSGSSQGVKVSVGGFRTPGTAGTERFKTAAIVQRIEKCRLLAYDGLQVLLAGLIDDYTTVSNGFSLDIVQGFLSGFPYTWNFLLNSELCASNPRHPDPQTLGNCGLDGGMETSQLSFEGSDQEKKTLSPSFCGHQEGANIKLNLKEMMATAEVQSEKEAATIKNNDSNTQPAVEGGEQLDTVNLRDDEIKTSNSAGLDEQEIINVRIEEGQQEIAHVAESTRSFKKRPDRASKRQPYVGGDEDGTALTQRGAGNALLSKSNGSVESVEKSDKCGLTPRITRSMQKSGRHMDHIHVVSAGVNTVERCDSLTNCEEVYTPVEHCGSYYVKPISGTTASTIHQKRMDKRKSRRTLQKNNDRENINGGKSSTSPCYYTGVKSPFEMGAQRPESSMNAEASPTSKEEGCANHQKEACTLETVQACDYGTADEENVIASVQMSEEHASSSGNFAKMSQKELNKRERNCLSKSPGQGSKCPKILRPLPRPKAPLSKRLISAAFGLKTSRSGRLLVPPLAHWCSQALLRDKDGGIIGISQGSKDTSEDGYIKFMPPAEAGLRKLRKQFCEAASTPCKKRLDTKKRH